MNKRSFPVKKLAVLGVLSAMCIMIGYLESLMPPIFPFLPFAKLGFGNIVVLFTLIIYGIGEGFLVLGIKCLVLGLIAGNPMMILYSLGGGLLSLGVEFLLLRLKANSIPAVSCAGGAAHGLGQIAVGSAFAGSGAPFYYLPHLSIFGSIAGIVTGIIVFFIIKKLPEKVVYIQDKNENNAY
ncbi:MAG: Gx transporter family protein [Clostridia bacterium]|nr:Gx transporter family protein [Clostridia bacterium]